MPDYPVKERYTIEDLRQIVAILRGKDGCPWDREQTHQSIRRDFIEETYEAVEAIDLGDADLLREELGDVLLQVVFHARLEEEEGRFALEDVVSDICKKLIVRHPHVFGDVTVSSLGELLQNWEAIKNEKKGVASYTETLELVPKVYPGLMRAQKVAKRAAKAGFCFGSLEAAFADVRAELAELSEAVGRGDKPQAKEELGDLLFACANLARHLGEDAEEALSFSCEKFIARFRAVEAMAREAGQDMAAFSDEERAALWGKAKENS